MHWKCPRCEHPGNTTRACEVCGWRITRTDVWVARIKETRKALIRSTRSLRRAFSGAFRSVLRMVAGAGSAVSAVLTAGRKLLMGLRRGLGVRILTWPRFFLLLALAVFIGYRTIWVPPFGSGCWERQTVLYCRHTSDGSPDAEYTVHLPPGARFANEPGPQSVLLEWPDGDRLGMALGRWEDQSLLQLSNFDLREAVSEYTSEWSVQSSPAYRSVNLRDAAIVETEPCPFGDLPECQIGVIGGDRQGSTVWIYLPFHTSVSNEPTRDLLSIVGHIEFES